MAPSIAVYLLALVSFLSLRANAHRSRFAYSGHISPDKWGDLSPEYCLCANGTRQSPINIVRSAAVLDRSLKPLDRHYHPANCTLVDNGFNVMVKYGGDVGTMVMDGKNYTLEQLHWHSPSEHTIDGVQYPMEMHLVHVSADGNISVVAVLYKYGRADPFLLQFEKEVGQLTEELKGGKQNPNVTAGLVQTKALRGHTNKYYRYVGSLTTPPCTENVVWNVLGKVREISQKQAASLSLLLQDDCRNNSRPCQPLNGRQVRLYHEGV